VRVVAAHDGADDVRALSKLRVGEDAVAPHRKQDAPLNGLQTVANVRKRAARDDRQRVIEVANLGDVVERDVLFGRRLEQLDLPVTTATLASAALFRVGGPAGSVSALRAARFRCFLGRQG
jgi:hypothetical protein